MPDTTFPTDEVQVTEPLQTIEETATEAPATEEVTLEEVIEEELIIEDFTIDGICGVY